LLPLLAFHFHQCSWPALFASLLSGLFTLIVLALGLPLSLLGACLPKLGILLGPPLTLVLRAVDATASFSAALPWSAYSTGLIPRWLLASFALWAVLAIFGRHRWKIPLLSLAAAMLLGGLLWQGLPWAHRHPGSTRLWLLDIGQGDSTLMEFDDGRLLLVDGGPASPDAGSWVVVPALRALGMQRLDWALATHADADHVGGLAWVLGQFPVKELLWNGQAVDSSVWKTVTDQALLHGIPMRALGSAIPRVAQDGPWVVLNPSPSTRKRQPKRPDTNGASVVLRVQGWLLMTGDFPKPGERRLVKQGLLQVQVLKVGHHGSRNSSSKAFVQALNPRIALISCGRQNIYGHPSAAALEALRGRQLYRTDQEGCVELQHWDDGLIKVMTWWPEKQARLWLPKQRGISAWKGVEP
jgi:competence protein ComEC